MRPFELNPARLTLLVGILFTLLASAVFHNPSIMFMAGMLLCTPLLAAALGRWASRQLEVTHRLPATGMAGDLIHGQITVRNRARWPVALAQVHSGAAAAAATSATHSTPAVSTPAVSTPAVSTPAVVAQGVTEYHVPLLRPGETRTWSQQWLLRRRGVHQMAPAWAWVSDPLRLVNELAPQGATHEIVVLPRPLRVDRLGFLGGSVTGLHAPQHAATVADALDFHGVRPWLPGEGIRRLHWKSTARTGQLHVVEWEENIASDVTVLLDTQAACIAGAAHGTAADNTLEAAITLTASIAVHLLEGGYGFQLFYWHPRPSRAAGAETERRRDPTARRSARAVTRSLSPQFATDTAFQLRRHDARSASSIGATLHLLAGIEAVSDPTATLPRLAQAAAPLLAPARSSLVIASTRADIDGALRALSSRREQGARAQALALDAASFDGAATSVPATFTGPVRVVHRGDSLAAALERSF